MKFANEEDVQVCEICETDPLVKFVSVSGYGLVWACGYCRWDNRLEESVEVLKPSVAPPGPNNPISTTATRSKTA